METGRVVGVGSDFAVDLDESLHKNGSDFAFVQCVLKAISAISTGHKQSYRRKRIKGRHSRPLWGPGEAVH